MNKLQMYEMKELREEKEKFEVNDQSQLNWVFRKLAVLNDEKNNIKEIAEQEKERITAWEQEELEPINVSIGNLESLVTEYHMRTLKDDPSAKTLRTPHGKSKSTTRKAAPVAKDKDKLLEHVKAAGMDEYVKVKEEVKWSDLKKSLNVVDIDGKLTAIDENGQEVAGVIIEPAKTTYKIDMG
ncbi:host-nuclease inhibitor Gam family protein [Bacillus sp. FSL W7-1360]